jgi:hypothetical protein
MTLSSTTIRQSFSGNGTTTDFAIPFTYFNESEVLVYLRNENVIPATESLKTVGALQDYTLIGGNSGLNVLPTTVSFNTAPASGYKVVIIRDVPNTQTVDYVNDGSFAAEDHEEAMDRIVAMVQEVAEKQSRSPSLPITSAISNVALPEPVAGQSIRWDSGATSLEAFTPATGISSGSSTDNAVVRWDGTSGGSVQNSSVIISDANTISGLTKIDVDNLELDGNTLSTTNANGNLLLAPNGSGKVSISGLLYPIADGTNNQVMKTNGSGVLSFGTVSMTFDNLSDVTVPSPSANDLVYYNGSAWVNVAPASYANSNISLDNLSDVTLTSPASGNMLKYNGSAWINATAASVFAAIILDDISDVTITSATSNDLLKWNGSAWVNVAPAVMAEASIALGNLSNVATTSPSSGQFLGWNGSTWTPTTASFNAALDDLTDVTITSAAAGNLVYYNGSAFVNVVPATWANTYLNLADLANVTSGIPSTNQVLYFDGTNWAPQTVSTLVSVGTDLDKLTDVVISSPSSGQFLSYNGSSWVNSTLSSISGTVTVGNLIDSGLTASTVPYANGSKQLTSSAVTPTELGYLSGVTSAIQTQIDSKQSATLASTKILVGNGSNVATAVNASGDVTLANTGAFTVVTVGGVAAANLASTASVTPTTSAISASAIDWSTLFIKNGLYTKTLSANTTFTFSNKTSGQSISVRLTNTASNYTVTWPTVKWATGSAPTMTTGAKSDIYTFIYDGTDVFGSAVQNMS